MTIVYEPKVCYCRPPRNKPDKTIWQCDDCETYWVCSDGRWYIPIPFGPTARRIKRHERRAQL